MKISIYNNHKGDKMILLKDIDPQIEEKVLAYFDIPRGLEWRNDTDGKRAVLLNYPSTFSINIKEWML